MSQSPYISKAAGIVALVLSMSVMLLGGSPSVAAQTPAESEQSDCRMFDGSEHSVCEPFLNFWESNQGATYFGDPVTSAYEEVSADSLKTVTIQYFERARLEHHPENTGTPYEIVPGRIGAETLTYAKGVNWHTFPQAADESVLFFPETGHAVGAEFISHYRDHGLDLGDPGVSLRESIALFGLPISDARIESNSGGDEVLTQWFERSRLELSEDGEVATADLGIEMTSTVDGFSPRIQREFDANLNYWHEQFDETAFIAGIWVPGIGDWSAVIGEKNRETGEAITFDDHMRIGSTSKEFTVTIILQLADEGLLSLDDTIGQYVDGIPNGDRITLRQLANMTSGLASFTFDPGFQDTIFNDPDYVWTPEEIVEIGVRNTQDGCPYFTDACFEPGEAFFYSNTNTVLLGMVAETASGETLDELMETRIFEPLGMENTFQPDTSELPEPFAHGYTIQGLPEGSDELQDSTFWHPSWQWAVGGLVSTMEDLRIWARAVGAGELISEEMQQERLVTVQHPPNNEERAYAVGIGYQYGWWGHGGSLPGYNSSAYYRPDLDAVVVVLANSDQLPLGDQYVSPGHVFADVMIEIANREAPLGDFDSSVPWGEILPQP